MPFYSVLCSITCVKMFKSKLNANYILYVTDINLIELNQLQIKIDYCQNLHKNVKNSLKVLNNRKLTEIITRTISL